MTHIYCIQSIIFFLYKIIGRGFRIEMQIEIENEKTRNKSSIHILKIRNISFVIVL